MTIERTDAEQILAGCHPRAAEDVARTTSDWAPELSPITTLFGSVGFRLGEAALTAEDRERVASAIETLLVDGDEEVSTATATGLLEALVSASARHADAGPTLRALGPHAKAYIRAWDESVGSRTPEVWDEEPAEGG